MKCQGELNAKLALGVQKSVSEKGELLALTQWWNSAWDNVAH